MVVLRSLVGSVGGVGCALVLAAASLSGCSSESDKKDDMTAGQGSMPPAMSGTAGGGGFGNVGDPVSASAGSSGSSAGSSGATSASAGASGAGSGGSAGSSTAGSSAAGSGGSEAGSSADAGVTMEEDPFGGLFDPGPVSCEGFLCLEAADCASLYPDENTTCKFTNCVDFMCSP